MIRPAAASRHWRIPFLLLALALLPVRQTLAGPADAWDQSYRQAVYFIQINQAKKAETLGLESLKQAESLGPFPRNFEVLRKSLNLLASFTDVSGRYAESVRYRMHALELEEKFYGPRDGQLCITLTNLAKTYDAMGRPEDAARALERSVTIREVADPRTLVSSLMPLAEHYEQFKQYPEAEAVYKRVLVIFEARGGPKNPSLKPILERLASISAHRGNAVAAKSQAARAAALPD